MPYPIPLREVVPLTLNKKEIDCRREIDENKINKIGIWNENTSHNFLQIPLHKMKLISKFSMRYNCKNRYI